MNNIGRVNIDKITVKKCWNGSWLVVWVSSDRWVILAYNDFETALKTAVMERDHRVWLSTIMSLQV